MVHEVFQTQRIEHAFLEPESTLVVPEGDGRFTMYSGGQGVWDDRDQVASVLDIDPQRITAELVSNGGAFGGKEDMANQAQTALAAFLLDAPVKCTLSREESLFIHPKRHPIRIDLTVGCDADGKLTALRARMVGDSGPYASVGMKVLERAAGHASGPYHLPAIDVEAFAVRTNNSVCGAFRGFGANQAQFAMEGALDRLAEMVGISGWEIRQPQRDPARRGVGPGPGDGRRLPRRAALPRRGEARVRRRDRGRARGRRRARAEELGPRQRLPRDRARGRALRGRRHGRGAALLDRDGPGRAHRRRAGRDRGARRRSRARSASIVDTTRELGAGQTTGSRGTLMGAGAVADACRAARADGCRIGVDYEGEYRVDWTSSITSGVEQPVIHSAFGYAAQLVIIDRETGDDRAGGRRARRRAAR